MRTARSSFSRTRSTSRAPIYLCDGSLRERIGLMNHGAAPVSFTLSLAFASDFADIFEVRGIKRERRGQVWAEVLPSSGVRLSYRGLDAALREIDAAL